MAQGLTRMDPPRVHRRGTLRTGRDVVIDINYVFEASVALADGGRIGPTCILKNCTIGAGTRFEANSVIDDAEVAGACTIGPSARLRPGTRLAEGAKIGNFVETKNARIGTGSKVNHLSYIGDTQMGYGVKIGAGTITSTLECVTIHQS